MTPKTQYISLFLKQHDYCSVPAIGRWDHCFTVAIWLSTRKITWLGLGKHCGCVKTTMLHLWLQLQLFLYHISKLRHCYGIACVCTVWMFFVLFMVSLSCSVALWLWIRLLLHLRLQWWLLIGAASSGSDAPIRSRQSGTEFLNGPPAC